MLNQMDGGKNRVDLAVFRERSHGRRGRCTGMFRFRNRPKGTAIALPRPAVTRGKHVGHKEPWRHKWSSHAGNQGGLLNEFHGCHKHRVTQRTGAA